MGEEEAEAKAPSTKTIRSWCEVCGRRLHLACGYDEECTGLCGGELACWCEGDGERIAPVAEAFWSAVTHERGERFAYNVLFASSVIRGSTT